MLESVNEAHMAPSNETDFSLNPHHYKTDGKLDLRLKCSYSDFKSKHENLTTLNALNKGGLLAGYIDKYELVCS